MDIIYDSNTKEILSITSGRATAKATQEIITTNLPHSIDVIKSCYKIVNGYLVPKHVVKISVDKWQIAADGVDECTVTCHTLVGIGDINISINEASIAVPMKEKKDKWTGSIIFSTLIKGIHQIGCNDPEVSYNAIIVEGV